ncbi:MAG: ribosomal-protein-alanine N-acetyltransferase [Geobacteraceae bacterium GWC2_48_7]|nr:MAG: ribosomal-protein-alanine N-acetyltransferase [Geobacteraceae bacterium GWC2_48_7]
MSENGTLLIRPLAEQDLDQVLLVEQASFPVPWRREHFLHEITTPHSFPFAAVADGVIVGYLCLHVLFETAEILDVAVAPERRGEGIAKLLLEHAEETARSLGAEQIVLEVRASNHAALALYENIGFVRSGIRKQYYEGTEDAVLMEKRL